MLPLPADVSANTDVDKAPLKRIGLFGSPGITFWNAAGSELDDLCVVGFVPTEQFLPTLEYIPRESAP